MATLKDISKVCGVTPMTVSKVLTGKAGGASPAMRQRILDVAAEMHYKPNAIARSLRTKSTRIIGLYSGYGHMDAKWPYFADILSGMVHESESLRYGLLLQGGFGISTAEGIYRELADGKIDGVILLTPPSDRLVELIAASSLPALGIVDAVPGLPSVVVDDIAGARAIAEHIAVKGHRRVMYSICGIPRSTSSLRRLTAFRAIAAGMGIDVLETIEAEDGWALSYEQKELMARPKGERPTAAVCWHDESAYGMVKTAREFGLRVPEDLAVVGFNGVGNTIARYCRLTTARVDWEGLGAAAVRLMADVVAGRQVPAETVLPVDLVQGDTS